MTETGTQHTSADVAPELFAEPVEADSETVEARC
jgi:hypothetical protein